MEDPVTLVECDARAGERPDELDSYLCYWILAPLLSAAGRMPSVETLDGAEAVDQAGQGGFAADIHQHLARQARGAHAGLDAGDEAGPAHGCLPSQSASSPAPAITLRTPATSWSSCAGSGSWAQIS